MMTFIKAFFKWFLMIILSCFVILSIIPYCFSTHLKNAPEKPFESSYFFNYNHTLFHFRLFVPKQIKHKALLIHGFSASTFSFRNNIDALTKNNTLVVAMDMPAFGYSDKSEQADYSDTNKIQAIHYLLSEVDKRCNSNSWHLIGHSMGGTVIGAFASSYPQQTQSLIFIDGLPFSQTHSSLQAVALYPPLLKWADLILEKKFLNTSSFQELLSSAYNKSADENSANGYMKPFETKNSGSAIFRMAASSGFANINDSVLNHIQKIIIWGKQDQWIPIKNASESFNKANTQTYLIENAGHCPMETHSEMVNTAIINFISKLE